MSDELRIPRNCNGCGKRFIYVVDADELHQRNYNVDYLCDDCTYGPSAATVYKVLSDQNEEWKYKLSKFVDLLYKWDQEHPNRWYSYYLSNIREEDKDMIAELLRRAYGH